MQHDVSLLFFLTPIATFSNKTADLDFFLLVVVITDSDYQSSASVRPSVFTGGAAVLLLIGNASNFDIRSMPFSSSPIFYFVTVRLRGLFRSQ